MHRVYIQEKAHAVLSRRDALPSVFKESFTRLCTSVFANPNVRGVTSALLPTLSTCQYVLEEAV